MKKPIFVLVAAFLVLTIAACKKDSNTTTLKINLTDAPLDAEEVNIDLVGVSVNYTGEDTGWTDLTATPGVYNLLGLQNGLDTLIAQGTVPTGTLKEIRL